MTEVKVYTVPATAPFLDTLAAGLIDWIGEAPLALAGATVLLPTRRSCRGLTEAFLRLTGGAPLLLPRIRPIGDVDEAELAFAEDSAFEAGPAEETKPAIPRLRRQLLLAALIQQYGAGQDPSAMTADQAARLAAELARLLDQVQTERLDLADLAALAPETYSEHWQTTIRFLEILSVHWPKILAAEQAVDPATSRNHGIEAQARHWRDRPPEAPVVAAGSTASIPATADLLAVVAGLPNGRVVLPGLDRRADDESWRSLEPSHPQFGLARLLDRLGLVRDDVAAWPAAAGGERAARTALVSEAMRPAATADAWRHVSLDAQAAIAGVHRVDCPSPREEASVIALVMRETLETAGKTAALVTPDRGLARRVAAELGRWRIEIDDSAGQPLAETPPGGFLRLVAEMVESEFAPVAFLSVCKHPLAAGRRSAGEFRALTRAVELAAFRGPRRGGGIAGIRDAVNDDAPELGAWIAGIEDAALSFRQCLAVGPVDLADLVRAHVGFAEWLAGTADETGAARLWSGDDGEASAAFIADLLEAAPAYPPVAGRQYPALLDSLMAGRAVRPRHGRHPRLNIWGLLEARLQQADVLILGGLNEGTWPAEAAADPWMSRPMRAAFGLPAPERRIGLAAHDFAQALAASEVYLTRAERVEGTPTVPSRWLARLDTVLRAAGVASGLPSARGWLHWAAALDSPAEVRPTAPPAPRPPVAARPRRLPVTGVETWIRDPYAIYARYILRLRPLDPIDADPGAAERGIYIHMALQMFVDAFPDAMPPDAAEKLLQFGREAFAEALSRPGVAAFWWPRFERIADWFAARETARRATIARSVAEVAGTLEIDGPAGPFTVSAKADRIDRLAGGGLAVIDYKTGAVPPVTAVVQGLVPQLTLEAAIAAAGGFDDVPPDRVADLRYWRLTGGRPAGSEIVVGEDPTDLAEQALAGLRRLVAAFDDESTPYRSQPAPALTPRFGMYDHLARVKEWRGGIGDGTAA